MRKVNGEFSSLVQLWNPKRDLSRACGLPDQNAIKWYQRNSIPPEYFPEIVKAYADLPPDCKPRDKNGKLLKLTEMDLLGRYVRRWR